MKRGIALVLLVGILTLLLGAGVSMVRLSLRLREAASAGTDAAQARLLARSGLEYVSARLRLDAAPMETPTSENQSDDWACRDDPATPLEQALNPSYAQGEPYRDVARNGRYDLGFDPFTDLDGDGRFDAWSGRLKGRYGPMGGTFALQVSGRNGGGGGINVNTGYLENTDLNPHFSPEDPTMIGNGVPDYQDLGSKVNVQVLLPTTPDYVKNGGKYLPVPEDTVPSDVRVAPGVDLWDPYDLWSENRKPARTINQLGLLLGIATHRPGDRIILKRPLGGYRDLEEVSRCFENPVDWERMRPHLTVASRVYPSAPRSEWLRANWVTGVGTRAVIHRYLLDAGSAAPEAIAAGFSWIGFGWFEMTVYPQSLYRQRDPIVPLEALNLGNFLKKGEYESWYDLYVKLIESAETLFAATVQDPRYTGNLRREKAALAHALASPELTPSYWPDSPEYRDWNTYGIQSRMSRLDSLDEEASAQGVAVLGFGGPGAVLSVESLGTVAGDGARVRARKRASGLFLNGGRISAQVQDDFENLNFDPDRKQHFPSRACDGGAVLGRPARDRVSTYPCFSRDVCLDLSRWEYPGTTGQLMLLDRLWIDPEVEFCTPHWDLHQPGWIDRPASELICAGLLNDVVQGFRWDPSSGAASGYRAIVQAASGWCTPTRVYPSFSQTHLYAWVPQGKTPTATQNDGPPPWVSPESGNVESGTHLLRCSHIGITPLEMIEVANSITPSGLIADGIVEGRSGWRESRDGSVIHSWNNSVPLSDGIRDQPAFAFEPGRMDAYLNGIPVGTEKFETLAWDPARQARLKTGIPLALWLYRKAMPPEWLQVHGLQSWFWTADPPTYPNIPSFTSPLYRFDAPVDLLGLAWDGFVPKTLGDAAGGEAPIRVELLVYPDGNAAGTPIVVPFPLQSWKTGGIRTDYRTLWRALHPELTGLPPKAGALHYRVWMDVSSTDLPQQTPVFDGIEIGLRGVKVANIREW